MVMAAFGALATFAVSGLIDRLAHQKIPWAFG
jgi:hypothetical protein